jgi:exopolysaccharide biosynthesis polyprenyl glycosylphosphotransferase
MATGVSTKIASPGALSAPTAPARFRRQPRTFLGITHSELGLAVTDAVLVYANGLLLYYLRFGALPTASLSALHPSSYGYSVKQHMGFLLLYAALVVLACQSQNLYKAIHERSALDESLSVLKAVFLATLVLTLFIYVSGAKTLSRLVIGSTGVLTVFTLVLGRMARRKYIVGRLAQGFGIRNVLIVGAGQVGQTLANYLSGNRELGFRVLGFLDSNHHGDAHFLGNPSDLVQVAREYFVDDVFVTIPSERQVVKSVILEARKQRLNVHLVPDLYDGLGWGVGLHFVGDFPVLKLHEEPIPEFGLSIKRLADVLVSFFGLLLLLPFLGLLALLIKLDSDGPILYRSRRVGSKARKFTCYKFRTMIREADAQRKGLEHLNEREGVLFKISNDPRITRIGRWMRKYSLDELPQLWNILKGEMSLVGPRPPLPGEYVQYRLEHLRRLDVTPGLTGLWQVTARQDPSFASYLALDCDYIENWSLWLDFKILLKTVAVVAKGTGT